MGGRNNPQEMDTTLFITNLTYLPVKKSSKISRPQIECVEKMEGANNSAVDSGSRGARRPDPAFPTRSNNRAIIPQRCRLFSLETNRSNQSRAGGEPAFKGRPKADFNPTDPPGKGCVFRCCRTRRSKQDSEGAEI